MIGQGVLRECFQDAEVESVLAIGRSPTGQSHAKLGERRVLDPSNLEDVASQLAGYDACFFSAGATAVGLTEAQYTRVTFDLTVGAATTLSRINPGMTFIYVSGQGTDSTEKGRTMWARVKGRTENALLTLPFKASYMFRPGGILPLHGIRSKTGWYNAFYAVMRPFNGLLLKAFPFSVTTTERLGRAMLHVAKRGFPQRIVTTRDINMM